MFGAPSKALVEDQGGHRSMRKVKLTQMLSSSFGRRGRREGGRLASYFMQPAVMAEPCFLLLA